MKYKQRGIVMAKYPVDIFYDLLVDFFNKQIKGKQNAIIFFQGFPSSFYKALSKLDIKHITGKDDISDIGYINVSDIEPSKLLQDYIGNQGISWAYYEEFIAINEILNDLNIYIGEIIVVINNLFSVYYPIDVSAEINVAAHIFENDNLVNDEDDIQKYYSDFRIINNTGFFSYINKHYDIDTNKNIKEIDFYNDKSKYKDITLQLPEKRISTLDLETIKLDLQNGVLSETCYLVNKLNTQPTKDMQALNILGSMYNVVFKSEDTPRVIETEKEIKHLADFKKYWGESAEYRSLLIYRDPAINSETIDISQGSLITDIIKQCEVAMNPIQQYSDLIITAPTGAGKSLFFQVPGIYLHNHLNALTLVITPLIALMRDQVVELEERGVDFSTYINSEISYEQRQSRLEGIRNGSYSIVYLSPELLLANDIRNIIGERDLALVVVDEAHLVTSWGRDFRVDYWFLGDYLEKIRRAQYYQSKKFENLRFPVLCLTATAVFSGRDDVVGELQNSLHLNCSAEHIYIGYVRRDNIRFDIQQASKKRNTKKEDKV